MHERGPDVALPRLSEEFQGAELGDSRRTRRLSQMVQMAERAPGLSFPKMARSEAELEAVYRFFGNDEVEWQGVFSPHRERTVQRCQEKDEVLVLHDTTQFRFDTEDDARELGLLTGSARGFFGHFSLALDNESTRSVLGVVGFEPVVRQRFVGSRERHTSSEINQIHAARPRAEKERERWYRGVEEAQAALDGCDIIHVMDREADAYALWSRLVEADRRFVIRAVSGTPQRVTRVERALQGSEGQLLREVPLKHRREQLLKSNRKRPARAERLATLHFRAAQGTFERPANVLDLPESATVNVVDVYEPSPPEGQEPIHWTLVTSEPIDTLEQVTRIVDIYRARWTIEEYFKALKTGCAYEARQLETLDGLLKALALFIPIAWRMLVLRCAAREAPNAAAATVLDADELLLLRKISVRVKLPEHPTLEQALYAIAGLGGHLKRNGPPGWQTILSGYRDLWSAMIGFLAARAM
ncbi:MAG TPA: IS4 family transposase [Coriobacteriia bacterium]